MPISTPHASPNRRAGRNGATLVGSRERAIGPDEDCYVDEPVERLKQPGPTAPSSKAYPP